MLDVINLTKVYKVKGGVETRALDGVTLSFPETGMVFLLGKSGSGKSTLLNVCGGLDSPTGGEIVVKGKSSKDFSREDFDSYRNTYVGFVFQEYNILNEFSVEDNIALALELQGKPKDKDEIAKLLKQVDLDGYAKRKPNTLSGGQKQRIAIARALIKSPEIIMADEPTGALDSTTGKQVLETLKKLSENKLVIVVSHDRDFAEQYGDRIIELKDGKILSDVSKGLESQRQAGDGNVTVVGGNTLCINDGKHLTEVDYQFIREFIGGQSSAIITTGEKEIDSFKRVNRITDDGQREIFIKTDEKALPKKKYTSADSKFIRSRLPLKRAARIGVSSLKIKPIRLIFTILLCVVSFTMFGLFSTLMLYDEQATLKQSIQDSNISYLLAKKEYRIRQYSTWNGETSVYEYSRDGRLTQAEVDGYKDVYGNEAFGGVKIQNTSFNNIGTDNSVAQIYKSASPTYLAALPETNRLRTDLLAGSYPIAEDEVCISEYVAQCIIQNGFSDQQKRPTTLNDVVGKNLGFCLNVISEGDIRNSYKIVGVFDSNFAELLNDYPLLSSNEYEADEEQKTNEAMHFQSTYADGLHGVVFVCDSLLHKEVAAQKTNNGTDIDKLQSLCDYSMQLSFDSQNMNTTFLAQATKIPKEMQVFGKKMPEVGEAIVTASACERIAIYNLTFEQNGEELPLINKLLDIDGESRALYDWLGALRGEPLIDMATGAPVTVDANKRTAIATGIVALFQTENLQGQLLSWNPMNGEQVLLGGNRNFKIVGIVDDFFSSYPNSILFVGDEAYEEMREVVEANGTFTFDSYSSYEETKYVEGTEAIYNVAFLPYDHSNIQTDALSRFCLDFSEEDDTRVVLYNFIAQEILLVSEVVDALSKVFMWIGIILAVFSALLLSNFISVSIANKKKEIGILRAVGARGMDVFKIFFSESLAIALICTICSLIVCIATCGVLNTEMGSMLSGVSLFVFGPISIAILLGVALVTAAVATFLPVYLAARKKPVESIRAL